MHAPLDTPLRLLLLIVHARSTSPWDCALHWNLLSSRTRIPQSLVQPRGLHGRRLYLFQCGRKRCHVWYGDINQMNCDFNTDLAGGGTNQTHLPIRTCDSGTHRASMVYSSLRPYTHKTSETRPVTSNKAEKPCQFSCPSRAEPPCPGSFSCGPSFFVRCMASVFTSLPSFLLGRSLLGDDSSTSETLGTTRRRICSTT